MNTTNHSPELTSITKNLPIRKNSEISKQSHELGPQAFSRIRQKKYIAKESLISVTPQQDTPQLYSDLRNKKLYNDTEISQSSNDPGPQIYSQLRKKEKLKKFKKKTHSPVRYRDGKAGLPIVQRGMAEVERQADPKDFVNISEYSYSSNQHSSKISNRNEFDPQKTNVNQRINLAEMKLLKGFNRTGIIQARQRGYDEAGFYSFQQKEDSLKNSGIEPGINNNMRSSNFYTQDFGNANDEKTKSGFFADDMSLQDKTAPVQDMRPGHSQKDLNFNFKKKKEDRKESMRSSQSKNDIIGMIRKKKTKEQKVTFADQMMFTEGILFLLLLLFLNELRSCFMALFNFIYMKLIFSNIKPPLHMIFFFDVEYKNSI